MRISLISLSVCCLAVRIYGMSHGVCIFDIDDTLNRGLLASASGCGVDALPNNPEYVAVAGSRAVQGCLDNGYEVAIATAEHKFVVDLLSRQKFLSDLNPTVFTPGFFSSAAFQYGNSDKSISIQAIGEYYNVSNNCMLLFDDAASNGKTAMDMGVNWVEASEACRGNQLCPTACGISEAEYLRGMQLLQSKCV